MELWIRSQDKNSLTKVSNLSLQEIKHPVRHDTEYWGIGTYYDNLQMLGKYSTKERALEVLDEIQKYLTPTIQMLDETIGDKKVCQVGNIMTFVYEMPKE